MAISSEEIIELAKTLGSLSVDQKAEIEALAPTIQGEELENLYQNVLAVQKAEIEDMKQELEIRKQVAAEYKEYKADQAREQLQSAEAASQEEEAGTAESLLKNL